jgi:amino acid transporter
VSILKEEGLKSTAGSSMTKPGNVAEAGRLKRNALGVPQIMFFVVAMVGPLAQAIGCSPFVFGYIGTGTAGAYVLGGMVMALFAVGYVAMSRKVTSAGGFSSFVALAFGERAGTASAYVALITYNAIIINAYGSIGAFGSVILKSLFNVDVPWQVLSVCMMLLAAITGYREINLSVKVLGILAVCEIAILLTLDFIITFHGGSTGLSMAAFSPSKVFSGNFWMGLLWSVGCFGGIEATVVYGEEARNPKKTIPRATYLVVVLIMVFYSFTTWAITNGVGANLQDVVLKNPTGFIFDLVARYLGKTGSSLINIFMLTSIIASVIGTHNVISRYIYSLSRANALPLVMARTHPQFKSPHIASIVQSVISAAVIFACIIFRADPFVQMMGWFGSVGILGTFVLFMSTSLSVLVLFHKAGVKKESIIKTALAPIISFIIILIISVMAVMNFSSISGTTGYMRYLWLLLPLAATVGFVSTYQKPRGTINLSADFNEET